MAKRPTIEILDENIDIRGVQDVHEIHPPTIQDVREVNEDPRDVKIVNPEMLPVQQRGRRISAPSMQPSRPPTTTLEEDIRTAAQRDLNMTWENTQALISKIVVITTCCGVTISLIARAFWPETIIAFPSEWWAIVGLVIGFYFGRTNHARTTMPMSSSGTFNNDPLDNR